MGRAMRQSSNDAAEALEGSWAGLMAVIALTSRLPCSSPRE